MIKHKTDAEIIALKLYPELWVETLSDFKIDNNAGRRAVALEVLKDLINTLEDPEVARKVMMSFYRRFANHEAHPDDIQQLTTYMITSLMHIKMHMAKEENPGD